MSHRLSSVVLALLPPYESRRLFFRCAETLSLASVALSRLFDAGNATFGKSIGLYSLGPSTSGMSTGPLVVLMPWDCCTLLSCFGLLQLRLLDGQLVASLRGCQQALEEKLELRSSTFLISKQACTASVST